MPDESLRISFALPAVPQSLRAFVEKAATDRRFLAAFIESPLAALHGAGVPIRPEGLTQQDFKRWFNVLGKLQGLVRSGKVAEDFQFEQVFNISPSSERTSQRASTSTRQTTSFSNPGVNTKTGTQSHINQGFQGESPIAGQLGDQIIAPLLSPAHLATIATLMQAQLNTAYGTLDRE